MATCPTCEGTGKVPQHIATALQQQDQATTAPAPARVVTGGLCSCDGPPHQYSPGWCPSSGPVRRGYGLD